MRELPTEQERDERHSSLTHDIAPKMHPTKAQMNRQRPKHRALSPVTVTIVVAVIGLGAVWWFNHRQGAAAATTAGQRGGGRFGGGGGINGPLPVVVSPARKGNLNIYLDGLGTVTPLADVTIQTQISGLLTEFDFNEGQTVKKGDLLAVIDPRPYQVALEQAQGQLVQAQAQLDEAKADLSRYETLWQQNSIAKQQVDAQRATVGQYTGQVETDQAAIDAAKLNIAYCHIVAPVAGRVGLRQVDPGNYVTPSEPNGLVTLAQIEPISVIFTLPEDDIPSVADRLRSGAAIPAYAYDRTGAQRLATGTLTTIDNQADPSTGTFKLRATFSNDDEALFPNQFVNVRMLLDVHRGVTVIPTSAIERGQQGTFVYVVTPASTVTAQNVTLGPTEGERVEVTTGLNVGDRVVVDGADRLKDGMKVLAQSAAYSPRAGGRRKRPDGSDGGGQAAPPSQHTGGGSN